MVQVFFEVEVAVAEIDMQPRWGPADIPTIRSRRTGSSSPSRRISAELLTEKGPDPDANRETYAIV